MIMPTPDWQSDDGKVQLYNADTLDVLRAMPDNAVGLIATDPPYYKVKGEAWDRQWDKPDQFLAWLGENCEQWQRVLRPNGSLYCFASPRMAARVEVEVGRWFNVENSITWAKPGQCYAQKYGPQNFRGYVEMCERVIFAEHFNADNIAKGEAGYQAKCDELRGFVFEPLRAYLDGERERAGVTKPQVNAYTKTQMASHWFSRSQWALPTEHYYNVLRTCLSQLNHNGQYLRRDSEDLRREYEDLRREYEDLRRPFNVTADVPYTDVWTFPTVRGYKGKHPCEKPLAMMEHIITASSREDFTVFDGFMGSGTTGEAAVNLGRPFIGVEKDPAYFGQAVDRIKRAIGAPVGIFAEATP
jgi:site-specific DNA-methyltransferase (adenine-specific)